MIGFLSGQLKSVLKDTIILDVNGVGYELFLPSLLLSKYHKNTNQKTELFVHTAAKDNDISLYGFSSMEEKLMFKRLIKVPSVGPKTALLILSSYTVKQIEQAVEDQNINLFLKIKGLAKKTSQKVIIELRSQFKALQKETEDKTSQQFAELSEVLKNMGFRPSEITKTLPKIDSKITLSEQVKQALKLLGNR